MTRPDYLRKSIKADWREPPLDRSGVYTVAAEEIPAEFGHRLPLYVAGWTAKKALADLAEHVTTHDHAADHRRLNGRRNA